MLKRLKTYVWAQLVIIYTRYLVGGSFVFASIVKIQGNRFTTMSGSDAPIHSALHLFEVFYQSGIYWQFIGWGQLIAGFLLMTQRYSKLGALLFLPIIGNIFVITISYDFNYTPVITGLMLIAIILLVAWDWDTLKVIIGKKPEPILDSNPTSQPLWAITGLILFLFTAVYRSIVQLYNPILWFCICFIISFIAFLIWYKNINVLSKQNLLDV